MRETTRERRADNRSLGFSPRRRLRFIKLHLSLKPRLSFITNIFPLVILIIVATIPGFSAADVQEECRNKYFGGSSGFNDDSYYIRRSEITSEDGGVTTIVERFTVLDGDQNIRLFESEEAMDDCSIFFPNFPTEEYAGCAVDAFRNFALWFGRELTHDIAKNVITTYSLPDWLSPEDMKGNIWTSPADFESDLQNWFNAFFLTGDTYYQVRRASGQSVLTIAEHLSWGRPVLVLVDTGEKGTHWVVATAVHYNPVDDDVYFHLLWAEDEFRWLTAEELQGRMYFRAPEVGSHKKGTIIWVQTDSKEYVEIIGTSGFRDCVNAIASSLGNRFYYSYAAYDHSESCWLYNPNVLYPEHLETIPPVVYGYRGYPETTIETDVFCPQSLTVRFRDHYKDSSGKIYMIEPHFICEWLHSPTPIGPWLTFARVPCDEALNESVLSYLGNNVLFGHSVRLGIHPIGNALSRSLVSLKYGEPEMEPYEYGYKYRLRWNKTHIAGQDDDGDGVPNYVLTSSGWKKKDNCPCHPNPAQLDCNDDGIGDACDPVACVDFVGWGVNDVTPLGGGGKILWTGTPPTIRIDVRPAGGVVLADGEAPAEFTDNDIQVRWCDCSDFESEMECRFMNCPHAINSYTYDPQFTHTGWHMASLNETETLGAAFLDVDAPTPAKILTTNCVKWHPEDQYYWSDWGLDDQVTGLYAQHCSPEVVTFGDPEGDTTYSRGEGRLISRYWDWPNELWWRKPYQGAGGQFVAGGPFAEMKPPGWGFIWVRPQADPGPGWGAEASLNRDKYQQFSLKPRFGTMIPHLTAVLPGIYGIVVPGWGVVDPIPELYDMGLLVVMPEQAPEAGVFAYGPRDTVANSAIGGLVVVEVDRIGARPRTLGRATAAVEASAPATVGFSAAMVSFGAVGPGLMAAAPAEAGGGLAVFGGTLATGEAVNTLWLGRKRGHDRDGPSVWEFEVAPVAGERKPAPRSEAGLVFDRLHDRLLLYGGLLDDGSLAGDSWSYDLGSGEWNPLPVPRDLPQLRGFSVVVSGRVAYLLGGWTAHGSVNGEVLAVDLDGERPARVVGLLEDGPGARSGLAVSSLGGPGNARIVVQGGFDSGGVSRADAWVLDPSTGEWGMLVGDCAQSRCPPASTWPMMWSSPDGKSLLLMPTVGDHGYADLYWSASAGERWRSSREILTPPTSMDCDGDGVDDPGAGKACTSGPGWWAEVGRAACGAPGEELVCSALEPGDAEELARWWPEGWEWLLDVEVRDDGFAFAVTDSSLLVFDLGALAAGAAFEPVAEVELVVPGSCPWCGGPDFAFDVELMEDLVLVAAFAGLHVFDAADPAAPVETGFLPGHGPMPDAEVTGNLVYVADGLGVTVAAVGDDGVPVDIGRLALGGPVLGVEVSREEWLLWALQPARMRVFDLMPDPRSPSQSGQVIVPGLLSPRMKSDGRWSYLGGLVNRAFFAPAGGGLEARGGHSVRSWVTGRERHDGLAVRVNPLHNRLEVWEEVLP